jgi:hypothetical protein
VRIDRAGADDRALAGRDHGRQGAARGPYRRHEIDLQGGVPVRVADAQEASGPGWGATDIVDEDVDPVTGLRDQRGRSRVPGQVYQRDLRLAGLREFLELGRALSGARDDVGPIGHQPAGDRKPDSLAGAGDDGNPAREIQFHGVTVLSGVSASG